MGSWFQKWVDKKLFREETASATVLGRWMDQSRVAAFRLESGKVLELNVSEEAYRDLRQGRTLQIYWKGNDLLRFEEKP